MAQRSTETMHRAGLLQRIERPWRDLLDACSGLPAAAMLEPGASGDWSVKDVLAHVSTWEEESLRALPLIMQGRRPPRYGGIDRFNAEQSAAKAGLALEQVMADLQITHARLLDFLRGVPDSWYAGETRFRHRLRLDTYGHYRLHTAALRQWREARGL